MDGNGHFSLQLKKYGGKNKSHCPHPHTSLASSTLSPVIHHPFSGVVAFTDRSPYKLLVGLGDGHFSPEAKSCKHFSPSSLRLLCKQEVFEMGLTGALSLGGWKGCTPFVRAVFLPLA